jgi:hypothetical protein
MLSTSSPCCSARSCPVTHRTEDYPAVVIINIAYQLVCFDGLRTAQVR